MKTEKPESKVEASDQITIQEAARQLGQRGGATTRDRHGIEFYRQIGARGGETTKRRWGHLFSQFGKKGGRPRRPVLEGGMGEGVLAKKEAMVGPRDSPPA